MLVGLLAWGMARWPDKLEVEDELRRDAREAHEARREIYLRSVEPPFRELLRWEGGGLMVDPKWTWTATLTLIVKRLTWPLLALAAFLTWKLAWSFVARRKRRRERKV